MRRTVCRAILGLVLTAGAILGTGCTPSAPPPAAGVQATGAASADAGSYCKEHGVPEKFCTLCHEELKTTLLLCKEHGGIPEDICTLCHPEVEEKHNIEMCPEGHKLPKHFCAECAKARPAA